MYAIDYTDLGTRPVESTTLVDLEIDGQAIKVPEGTSVMRAAALLGTHVPKLCATDNLKSFGSCRLCLVEIEGRKGYPASCTTQVAPGMKVSPHRESSSQLGPASAESSANTLPARIRVGQFTYATDAASG